MNGACAWEDVEERIRARNVDRTTSISLENYWNMILAIKRQFLSQTCFDLTWGKGRLCPH